MATEKVSRAAEDRSPRALIPDPVPSGTDYFESLGRWIDNLMGDTRHRASARHWLASLRAEAEEVDSPDAVPPEAAPDPDPPTAHPPDAVPGGTEVLTKGRDDDAIETRRKQ